jgi:hypothetical protein
MELKKLLKYLSKEGYPGPNTLKVMEYSGYDDEEFLHDLLEELDYTKAMEFVSKTLGKLSSTSEISIKIDLEDSVSTGSWIYLDIYNFEIDLNSEYSDVLINYGWGDSHIIDPEDGKVTTLEDIADEVDMGGMSEYEDFLDSIRDSSYQYIHKNCGFGVWFN